MSRFIVWILVAGVVYGLFVAARATIQVLATHSDIAVAIIAAAATVVAAICAVVITKILERRLLIQKEHREKKTPVYEDLMKFMFRMSMATKTGQPVSEKDMTKFMSEFMQRFMVWGSDEVLAEWVKWRRFSTDDAAMKASPLKLLLLLEELILTIRRDLGHANKGLLMGDILACFVNDIDQHLPKKRS